MEITDNLKRFACLLATLNKEGLDTKLIELGVGLLPKLSDDESICQENDLEQVKILFKSFQEGKVDINKKKIDDELKDKKKVRAYVDGCYDLMHAGHYNALRQAKKLGDVLVWGVNSDQEIKKVKAPPVFNGDERCAIVRACKWVDEVAQDTEYTPNVELLDRYNCDFYAHGDDIALNSDGTDCAQLLKNIGRFKMFKRTKGVSTTDIAAKLLKIQNKKSENSPALNIIEEEKQEGGETPNDDSCPKELGSFNANPNFWASAKRIAQFSSIREPMEEDKIVYVDGSFDICHPGHIELLKKSKALGDYLIVGIHEDQWVNQYLGEHYPLNTLHERVLNILACKYVDDVIIGAPFKITEKFVKDLNISVVVKGLHVQQGGIKSEALDLKPYEYAKEKDILTEVDINCTITMKEIVDRILLNKEAITQKVMKSTTKQELYEKNSKFISEIR